MRDLAAEVKVLTIERNGAQHQARVNFDAMRDLAARVETLEQALREIGEYACLAELLGEDRPCSCARCFARAALAGQSTTEQP